jgi:hypothetical protein
VLACIPAGLLAEVEAKAAQPEYAQLLQDCRNVYCSIRQQVGLVSLQTPTVYNVPRVCVMQCGWGRFCAIATLALPQPPLLSLVAVTSVTAIACRRCPLPLLLPLLLPQVIAPHLSARLDSLSGMPLPQLVRGAAEQVLRSSQLEGQLVEQLFGSAVTAQRPPQAYGVQTQGRCGGLRAVQGVHLVFGWVAAQMVVLLGMVELAGGGGGWLGGGPADGAAVWACCHCTAATAGLRDTDSGWVNGFRGVWVLSVTSLRSPFELFTFDKYVVLVSASTRAAFLCFWPEVCMRLLSRSSAVHPPPWPRRCILLEVPLQLHHFLVWCVAPLSTPLAEALRPQLEPLTPPLPQQLRGHLLLKHTLLPPLPFLSLMCSPAVDPAC